MSDTRPLYQRPVSWLLKQPAAFFAILAICALASSASAPKDVARAVSPISTQKTASRTAFCWRECTLTQYHDSFVGKRMANGLRFSHSRSYVACRGMRLGTPITLRYWSGRRWAYCPAIVGDRPRYKLRDGRLHVDVPRSVARRLGLYRRNGDVRRGEWSE